MSIVALIILHLLAATFLHQRVPKSDDNRAALRRSSFADVLKQSRDSLNGIKNIQKHEKMKHSIEKERTQEVDVQGKKKIPSPDEANDARDKKRVGAKSRPQDVASKDDDKKSPKQQDEKKNTKIVENKAEVDQNDKLEAPDHNNHVADDHPEEQGTRVTDKAFIHDFGFDRQHPTFRMHEIEFPPLDARLESLESCGYISQHRLLTHTACRNDDTLLTVHNSIAFYKVLVWKRTCS